jgi:hypothetical protein
MHPISVYWLKFAFLFKEKSKERKEITYLSQHYFNLCPFFTGCSEEEGCRIEA